MLSEGPGAAGSWRHPQPPPRHRGSDQAPRASKVRSSCAGGFPLRPVPPARCLAGCTRHPKPPTPKPCHPSHRDTHPNRGSFPASSGASACDGERKHQSWICFHGNGLKKNKSVGCTGADVTHFPPLTDEDQNNWKGKKKPTPNSPSVSAPSGTAVLLLTHPLLPPPAPVLASPA